MIRLCPPLTALVLACVLAHPLALQADPAVDTGFGSALAAHNAGDFAACLMRLETEPPVFQVHYLRALCSLRSGRMLAARKHMALSGHKARSPVQIRDQRRLERLYRQLVPVSFSLGLAVRPSDNVDRTTDAESVTVNGLEFQVQDDPKSGVSVVVEPRAQFRLVNTRLWGGQATVHLDTDYRYESLSDTYRASWDVRLRGTHSTPQQIHAVSLGQFNDSLDEKVSRRADYLTASRTSVIRAGLYKLDGRAELIDWPQLDETGWGGEAGILLLFGGRFRAGPVLRVGMVNTDSAIEDRDWTLWGVAAEARFGGRFSPIITFQGSRRITHYDEPHPFFGTTRRDTDHIAELGLQLPRAQVLGFAPKVTLRAEERASNIPLYSYQRSEFGISIARAF